MLTQDGCLQRQARLRQMMAEASINAVILSDPREIYYFTGVWLPPHISQKPCCLWVETGGEMWAILPETNDKPYVQDYSFYQSNLEGTISPDLMDRLCTVLEKRLPAKPVASVGYQANSLSYAILKTVEAVVHPTGWIAIDDLIANMQSRKDADEIATMRRSIEVNVAAYTSAAAAIIPGASELDVLAAGQRGALLEAGEWVYHNGDYQCGAFNGPARARRIEAGELYIIDAWSCYQGYWTDMSYAYVVGDQMTALQQSLFDHILWVQEQVPTLLKVGNDGRDIWHLLDRLIRQHPALAETGLVHHGGHSIGLRIHEMPDINRDRGGMLEIGNVVCVEPGAYLDAARYGVRIENMYLITVGGPERLSPYPANSYSENH